MTDTLFSHQKASDSEARYAEDGLRAFFAYRDMGIIGATHGRLRVQLVRAARKSSEAVGGTGYHQHAADVHVVYMVRGWANSITTASTRSSRPAIACTSARASSTASTTGRTTWNSWRSSLRLISALRK